MEKELKIWTNASSGEDNIIVLDEESIYRRRAKKEDFFKITEQVKQGKIDKKFIEVPLSYIKQIEYQDNHSKIKIHYGQDSEEGLKISDPELREEIMNFLKENTPVKATSSQIPPIFSRIRVPLLSLLVLIGIFMYVYSIIQGLNSGYQYEVRGRRPGLGSLVLGLAHLGLVYNLMIFIPLWLILLYVMFRKAQNSSDIHYLIYKR